MSPQVVHFFRKKGKKKEKDPSSPAFSRVTVALPNEYTFYYSIKKLKRLL